MAPMKKLMTLPSLLEILLVLLFSQSLTSCSSESKAKNTGMAVIALGNRICLPSEFQPRILEANGDVWSLRFSHTSIYEIDPAVSLHKAASVDELVDKLALGGPDEQDLSEVEEFIDDSLEKTNLRSFRINRENLTAVRVVYSEVDGKYLLFSRPDMLDSFVDSVDRQSRGQPDCAGFSP